MHTSIPCVYTIAAALPPSPIASSFLHLLPPPPSSSSSSSARNAPPNPATLLAAMLRECPNKPHPLQEGRRIHAFISASGLHRDRFLCNHLITMYGKCGALDDAKVVFRNMTKRNVLSWTAMIKACAENGQPNDAFGLFDRMMREGLNPNEYLFLCILGICSSSASLVEARKVHGWIKNKGFEMDLALGNALVNVYGKCGSLVDACRVFDGMPEKDVFSWTTLIDVYAKLGFYENAFRVFQQMQRNGVKPNKVTIVVILNVCNDPSALEQGRMIHSYIRESGIELNVVGWTALVNMYGKCGSLSDALKVFNEMPEHTEASWNTLISIYARNGKVKEVLDCFDQMKLAGMIPSRITFTTMLNACSSPADLQQGRLIYDHIVKSRIQMNVILGTALIRMFDKCGSIDDARQIFDEMAEKNVLTWTSMITAYCQCGKQKEAFDTYHKMRQEGIEPDKITFVSLLDACASLPNVEDGKVVHQHILVRGFQSDLVVATALLNMYAKCGSPKHAHMVYNSLSVRDVIVWNSMVTAYAQHGHGKEALQLCGHMQWDGVQPNEVTIINILSACSHAGLLEEGYNSFESFESVSSISTLDSYRCIIDLLARSGNLDKAEQLIVASPFTPDTSMWMALLSACKIYGDTERAKRVSEKILELASDKASAYVLLSDICAMEGNSGDVSKVREYHPGI